MLFTGCSRPGEGRMNRVALLPFENLTGDPSFDWIASAAPAIATAEITGVPKVLPLRVEAMDSAYLNQANQVVHGYFTARGKTLHFEISVEDAARHKTVSTMTADGSVLSATNAVAKHLTPAAHPFSTSNPDAVEAWGRGENERAVALDPNFGAAWVGWAQTLAAAGNTSQAVEVVGRALQQPSLNTPIERARLALISADLRKDADARRTALTTLAGLAPEDTALIFALADIEMTARRFAAAAGLYRKVLAVDPPNAVALNALGYAEAYAGHLDAARKTLEEYGRQPGQKPNSLDSMGEVSFLSGQFKDAEEYFLQAHDANAAFLGGAGLRKAADARWLAGDRPGADAIMRRFLDFRSTLHDPLLAWREAAWLYTTGRREQALAKLQDAPPAAKQLVENQLAVWRGVSGIPTDLSALKELYERTPPAADGPVRTFYAAALLQAGRVDDARKLLAFWPLPENGDSLLHSVVYPKFIELRVSAGLSR